MNAGTSFHSSSDPVDHSLNCLTGRSFELDIAWMDVCIKRSDGLFQFDLCSRESTGRVFQLEEAVASLISIRNYFQFSTRRNCRGVIDIVRSDTVYTPMIIEKYLQQLPAVQSLILCIWIRDTSRFQLRNIPDSSDHWYRARESSR